MVHCKKAVKTRNDFENIRKIDKFMVLALFFASFLSNTSFVCQYKMV
jgi:hypothetical protein